MFQSVGFIGFGLIGGSIARKIRQVSPATRLTAYSRSRAPLEAALSEGNLDRIAEGVDASFSDCDLVLLCTPVTFNEFYLEKLRPFLAPGAIVSDVGSTKTNIHEAAARLEMEEVFLGGHPMAGSERTGYACSKANLLENAYYIITPTPKSSVEQIDRMVSFARELSALPLVLDCHEHDLAVAAISHIPHLIAASLVNLVADSDSEKQTMRQIAAGGFKDITRIASSSPEMWEQICMANRANIIPLMERYIESLRQLVDHMRRDELTAVSDAFVRSGAYRSSITDRGGSTFNPKYSLFCDIPDKSGSIAVIASLLSFEDISIKNIGINHNRERQEGTLMIEFHDGASLNKATECLTLHHFPVYPRR